MVRSRMAVRRRPRRRSSLSWARATVAPWIAGAAVLISITAEAGQEPAIGTTRLDLTDLAPAAPIDLVPSLRAEGIGFPLPPGTGLAAPGVEVEPRAVLKARGGPPTAGTGRGDPAVPVRPTFDTGFRAPGALPGLRAASLVFAARDPDEVSSGFEAVPVDAPWPPPDQLTPLPANVTITTRRTRSANSPAAEAGPTTPHVQDGSTPPVGRAESLASTTPAPVDATPIEIAALPKFSRGPRGLVTSADTVGIVQPHPDYATLIETAKSPAEQRCLAQAIYFEARSEPEEGQAAVAQVVLNRALSGLYPGSVCGVVFQNRQRRNACQFSFACDGHPLRVDEGLPWANAVRIAREVTEGVTYVADVGASTHYHANYVRPVWARSLTRTDVIGHHVFYALKPGQT